LVAITTGSPTPLATRASSGRSSLTRGSPPVKTTILNSGIWPIPLMSRARSSKGGLTPKEEDPTWQRIQERLHLLVTSITG